MPYDLTINRVCALAGQPLLSRDGEKTFNDSQIIAKFRDHADRMLEQASYTATIDIICKEMCDARYLGGLGPQNALEPVDITRIPIYNGTSLFPGEPQPVVALFPALRFSCTVDGFGWILRTRATATACAIQRPHGLTKLWWTFEGIPEKPDPEMRPDEKHVAAFIDKCNDVQEQVVHNLFEAYHGALNQVTNPKSHSFKMRSDRIRVSMADNYDDPVAALCDVMYFDRRKPSEIRRAGNATQRAVQGLDEFELFVTDVTPSKKKPLDDAAISVTDDVIGTRAILFKHAVERRNVHRTVVAGFARSAAPTVDLDYLSPAQRMREREENTLRAKSAARPVSAWLADREAAALERAQMLEPA